MFSFLLGNFDACDFVRQANEPESSLLAQDRSDGKRNIARFYFERIISHAIQSIKLEVNASRILPFYLVIASPWTSLSASPPDRSFH